MKALTIPCLLLTLLLAFSLWVSTQTRAHTGLCAAPLRRAASSAAAENWADTDRALEESYRQWQQIRPYFHTVMEHADPDEAEALYAEAFAACAERDAPDLRAALARLLTALHRIAEKQSFRLGNIL